MSQSTVPVMRLEPVNPQTQPEHFTTDSEVVRAPYLYCFLRAVFKPTCVGILLAKLILSQCIGAILSPIQ